MTGHTIFLIAGTQRTGTTLLRTSLSSDPAINCHGEVFKLGRNPYSLPGGYWSYCRQSVRNRLISYLAPRTSCSEYLDWLLTPSTHQQVVGFKLMLDQADSRPYLWPLIAGFPLRSILVTRRNVLKTLLSRRTAAASGVYHVSETLKAKAAVSEWKSKPIRIDPATVIPELERIAAEPDKWRRNLASLPTIEIEYEAYAAHQTLWNTKILDFLGVPPRDLRSDLRKVNSDRLQDMISNYADVAAVVSRSPFDFCLDASD